jgi:23S rRNA (guanine2445-N2)-methyltransferase / 23S rRNA (guanine2069-N7)-methyltransferase
MQFTATCARGLEEALVDELTDLKLKGIEMGRGAVTFEGEIADGYRACLWSRIASRVLLLLGKAYCDSAKTLYAEARRIDWTEHLDARRTLAVEFVGLNDAIQNSQYGALVVKDAIVDRLRDNNGARPDIDIEAPDVRIHVYLKEKRARISLDLSGPPLHIRGHNRDGGAAPIRESLAAGLLRYARWHELGPAGTPMVDPMCGSGTFLIEAADVVRDRAPGLARERWGFTGWLQHDAAAWAKLMSEAKRRVRPLPEGQLFGYDRNEQQVDRARKNARRAGAEAIAFAVGELKDLEAPPGRDEVPRGLLVTNPPYGERLGDEQEVVQTHKLLGDVLRRRFPGWTGWVIAGSPALARRFGLKPASKRNVFNGPLDARWCEIPIRDSKVARDL